MIFAGNANALPKHFNSQESLGIVSRDTRQRFCWSSYQTGGYGRVTNITVHQQYPGTQVYNAGSNGSSNGQSISPNHLCRPSVLSTILLIAFEQMSHATSGEKLKDDIKEGHRCWLSTGEKESKSLVRWCPFYYSSVQSTLLGRRRGNIPKPTYGPSRTIEPTLSQCPPVYLMSM